MKLRFPRLMCLTTDNSSISHSEQVKELINSGADFIQLRTKKLEGEELFQEVQLANDYAVRNNTLLVVNDYVDVVQSTGAGGVHLGFNDSSIEYAIGTLGDRAIIGSTVHNLFEARIVKEKGLSSYVGLGPYRATTTKPDLESTLLESEIYEIIEILSPIPIYLIGGIDIGDCGLISKFNISGLAVCSSLSSTSCYGGYVRNFQKEIYNQELIHS